MLGIGWPGSDSSVDITLCVPAYQAEVFILETIDSIQNQTFEKFRCIVSVDLSTDKTFEKLNFLKKDKRFKIYRQKKRLGWAGNVNFGLRKSKTNYVCIVPHDDLLHPEFIEKLLPVIKNDHKIAAIYPDIELFGPNRNGTIIQRSVKGGTPERIVDYLENHYNAVLFRAIVNKPKVGVTLTCDANPYDDFSEDTIWGLKLALRGNLIRFPEVLYSKRYLETSHHFKWQQWGVDEKLEAWIFHCVRCLKVLEKSGLLKKYKNEFSAALSNRIYQRKKNLWSKSELQEVIHQADIPKILLEKIIACDE